MLNIIINNTPINNNIIQFYYKIHSKKIKKTKLYINTNDCLQMIAYK